MRASSPAIDTGMEASVYASFGRSYGLSMAFDRDGVARPAASGGDRWANER